MLSSQCVYHKKELVIVPIDTTDTTTVVTCETLAPVTFADVKTIFEDQTCTIDGCHAEGGTEPNLSALASTKSWISSHEVRFKKAINQAYGADESSRNMPSGMDKMPEDKIKTLETWICQGMKP